MMGWSKEIPKKEGFYWFFGAQFKGENPELKFVRVWRLSKGLFAYICEGGQMYKEEMGRGFWKVIKRPIVNIDSKEWEFKD
jgi:hypothetical protein